MLDERKSYLIDLTIYDLLRLLWFHVQHEGFTVKVLQQMLQARYHLEFNTQEIETALHRMGAKQTTRTFEKFPVWSMHHLV